MIDERLSPATITAYSTVWCPDCKRTKKFLGEQRVPYENIDIDKNLMTSMPGLFAAGDVRTGSTKQAASAVGEGATAALDDP